MTNIDYLSVKESQFMFKETSRDGAQFQTIFFTGGVLTMFRNN